MKLTDKETVELRIKCVEVFLLPCSKTGLEQDIAFEKGKKLWDFATNPPVENK